MRKHAPKYERLRVEKEIMRCILRCDYCGSAKHELKACPLNPPQDFLKKTQEGEIEKQPCLCVPCDDCRGTGVTWYWRLAVEEFEPCNYCRGGIVKVCDRCLQLEYEEAERY